MKEPSDELAAVHLDGWTTTDESTPDLYHDTPTTSYSDSGSSSYSFSSPFGFLQAALPHIPTSRLKKALVGAVSGAGGGDAEDDIDIDMEAVVDALLTSEYVKLGGAWVGSCPHRSGWAGDIDERKRVMGNGGNQEEATYPAAPPSTSATKRKTPRSKTKTILLTDVRQNHRNSSHTRSTSKSNDSDLTLGLR